MALLSASASLQALLNCSTFTTAQQLQSAACDTPLLDTMLLSIPGHVHFNQQLLLYAGNLSSEMPGDSTTAFLH